MTNPITKQIPEWLIDYPIESLRFQLNAYYKNNTSPKEKDERFNIISDLFEWDLETVEMTFVKNVRRKTNDF